MVARERNDAGDETAHGFAVGAPRPAHNPDQRAVPLVEHRPAGVAVADAEAGGFAEFLGIDQAELLRAWAIGRDQRDRAQLARGLAVALHSHTEARDDEPVADQRRRPPSAEGGRREIRGWRGERAQGHGGGDRGWGASARGENCGWGATLATSLTTGRRPSNASNRYLPLLSTQCAAVSTRSAAIATPVHRLCSPTISTTCRAIARSAKGAPPTMA